MSGLDTSRVYKCLEKKTLILGFEIVDLFVLSFLLCVLNFLFSSADFKIVFTFGPVLLLALLLRVAKRGQADNFILHWFKFQIAPGIIRAFPKASDNNLLQSLKKNRRRHARSNARSQA
jgi:type IV conjugative transfer system protein TraL